MLAAMNHAALCLLLAAMLVGGCAASRRSSDVVPPGMRLAPDQAFVVSVTATDPEYEKYTGELRALIAAELAGAGFEEAPHGIRLNAQITYFARGGAWGEEADCRMDVTLIGESTWHFTAMGGSGSEMVRDRIPSALRRAARAVVERIAMHR